MKNKPCPFCRMNDLSLFCDNVEESKFWVYCNDCGAEGPTGTEKTAWDVWNTRPEVINENIVMQSKGA